MYPLSVPMDGQALNITVFSYADNMEFGLTGDRRSVPRLQRLLTFLEESLVELEEAGRGRTPPGPPAESVRTQPGDDGGELVLHPLDELQPGGVHRGGGGGRARLTDPHAVGRHGEGVRPGLEQAHRLHAEQRRPPGRALRADPSG